MRTSPPSCGFHQVSSYLFAVPLSGYNLLQRVYMLFPKCHEYHSEFVTGFSSNYSRNNKSRGQKNLRCFPSCSESGHCNTGFCGRAVVVETQCYVGSPSEESMLIAFGDIVPKSEEIADIHPEPVALAHMEMLTHSDTFTTAPLRSSVAKRVRVSLCVATDFLCSFVTTVLLSGPHRKRWYSSNTSLRFQFKL